MTEEQKAALATLENWIRTEGSDANGTKQTSEYPRTLQPVKGYFDALKTAIEHHEKRK